MWWRGGGKFYWGVEREEERRAANGIVVIFSCLAIQEKNLKPFVDLYSSVGWISLVCHADFLTLFSPEKATLLGYGVLNELVMEIKRRPLPIVFVAFSGGSKGCMYKVLQLIEGKCSGQHNMGEYRLVRDCVCGQIYDSSPVDFTSDLGTQFVHPTVRTPRIVTWMAKVFASGLDTLFLSKFEAQRAEYWQTLYFSVSVGPILIFCSEDDELAPYPVVVNFAQRMQHLGGDVNLVKWSSSPHVGHYEHYPSDYKSAVTELFSKATLIYTQRSGKPAGMASSSSKISKSVWSLHKAAVSSNESLRRVATDPSDHFFLPSSVETKETEEQKGESFQMQNTSTVSAQGVLGQILFDVCIPKNIEGWDIKPIASRRHGPFNPIKCLKRSRL